MQRNERFSLDWLEQEKITHIMIVRALLTFGCAGLRTQTIKFSPPLNSLWMSEAVARSFAFSI
jgi:hypothetical protein